MTYEPGTIVRCIRNSNDSDRWGCKGQLAEVIRDDINELKIKLLIPHENQRSGEIRVIKNRFKPI